jgi:serine protease inhibitor
LGQIPDSVRPEGPSVLKDLASRQLTTWSIVLAGFSPLSPAQMPLVSAPTNGRPSRFVRIYNELGFDVLTKLLNQHPSQNVVISPLSIGVSLTMLSQGAASHTALAMRRALHNDDVSTTALVDENTSLLEALRRTLPGTELSAGNSLWLDKNLRLKNGFVRVSKQAFGTDIIQTDFVDPATSDRIESWVSNKFSRRIYRRADRPVFPRSTSALLLEAVHFKGVWETVFDLAATESHIFHSADGTTRPVKMMSAHGTWAYYRGSGFQIVEIPYVSRRFGLRLFLPDSPRPDFTSFIRAMNSPLGQLQDAILDLKIPRFNIESRMDLLPVLRELGMASAFAEDADFTEIVNQGNLHIDGVWHATFIDVSEAGTEGGAVTGIQMLALHSHVTKGIQVVTDHPFFFAIDDHETGCIVLMGIINAL